MCGDFRGQVRRHQQTKLQTPAVTQVDADLFDAGRCLPDHLFEFFPDLIQGIDDVLAGAEGVFTKIRT